MKLVSKAALGAALALGSLSMTVALPAYAAKEKKAKKGEEAKDIGFKLNLSKEFTAKTEPAYKAYAKKDWAALKAEVDALEPQATTPDEKYQVNDYRLSAGIGLNDTAIQSQAVDGMLATGLVQPDRAGPFHYYAGKWAYERKEYPRAETELKAAIAAGEVKNSDVYLTQARMYADSKRPAESGASLAKAVEIEKAAGKPVPEAWYNFGFTQAFNARNMPQYVSWSTGMLRDYPSADNWRVLLQNYLALSKNISPDRKGLGGGVDLDVYRLMRAAGALAGDDDVYDYAYLTNGTGLPLEAKAVLDGWKASGKSFNADMTELSTKIAPRAAADSKALAEVSTSSSSVGDAGLALAVGDYAKAATIYQAAIAKGGLKDTDGTTQMRAGIALALSGQKDAAKAIFAGIQGPRADLAKYWTTFVEAPPQPAKPLTTGQ